MGILSFCCAEKCTVHLYQKSNSQPPGPNKELKENLDMCVFFFLEILCSLKWCYYFSRITPRIHVIKNTLVVTEVHDLRAPLIPSCLGHPQHSPWPHSPRSFHSLNYSSLSTWQEDVGRWGSASSPREQQQDRRKRPPAAPGEVKVGHQE